MAVPQQKHKFFKKIIINIIDIRGYSNERV